MVLVSQETVRNTSSKSIETFSSPRISFSTDFLDEKNFISISPNPHEREKDGEMEIEIDKARNAEFEFLSSNVSSQTMITADELFYDGKVLPFWQMKYAEKLNKISLKGKGTGEEEVDKEEERSRVGWFVDDDRSPRPPKCTVLWKELLRLKKQRASSLSPSSSSSSSSSSLSGLADVVASDEKKESSKNRDKPVKKTKKGLERTTRSASIKIRPMINVPICTHVKSSVLPPLFPLKEGKIRDGGRMRKW